MFTEETKKQILTNFAYRAGFAESIIWALLHNADAELAQKQAQEFLDLIKYENASEYVERIS